MSDSFSCPACGRPCSRESADVGVGVVYGPWGCWCGWSENEEYDNRAGVVRSGDRVLDQWGVSHHVSRPSGVAVLDRRNVQTEEE